MRNITYLFFGGIYMIKLGICMKDYEFAKVLGEAISMTRSIISTTVIVNALTEEEDKDKNNELKKSLSNQDLILLEENMEGWSDKTGSVTGKNDFEYMEELKDKILLLSREKSKINNNKIYRFSRITDICEKIILRYDLVYEKSLHNNKFISINKIISLFSFEGGSGCTSIGIGIAKNLTKYMDKKVCYLSLEEIQTVKKYFKIPEDKKSIEEFSYYFLSNKKVNPDIFLMSDSIGVKTFVPAKGINPLYSFTEEEFEKLIDYLGEYFDYIIIDVGKGNFNKKDWIVCNSSKILLISNTNLLKDIEGKFCEHIRELCNKGLDNSDSCMVIPIRNMFLDEELPSSGECKNKVKIIYRDDNSFNIGDNHIEISMDNSFGMDINELCKELT